MISGVLYALLAGLMWGLIFVGPLLVPEYPAMLQSMGRYLALGLIALPLAWLGRARLRQLSRHDWWTALGLTMMGNLIYYVCLASAIQRTGAPVSTMIIGTLPVVLPVFANLLYSQRDGKLPWRRLCPALSCSAVGLICVNVAELRQGLQNFSPLRYGSGIALALGSVVCWACSGSSRSSRLIHRIMLFPFTLPAPRWRFTSRRRDDVQLTGRQPAHPPARGQLLIHAYPSPLSVPILQKPRPASLIPNRPAIAPLRKLRRAAGILNRLERVTLGRQQRQR